MKLTDAKIRTLPTPEGKSRKIADGHGLMLLISPKGLKSWYLRKHVNGKEQMIFLGHYPEVGLSAARQLAADITARIAQGLSPKETRKDMVTFGQAAMEWLKLQQEKSTPGYCKDVEQRLAKHILPTFGSLDITSIKPKQILDHLQGLYATGIRDTIKRLRMYMSMIFRYGIIAEYCESDPAGALQSALPSFKPKRMPARTKPDEVRALFHACCYYAASRTVRNALLFQALTAIRPGNAQKAEWSEIDFEKSVWTIQEGKMKMRREFQIPLSEAAIEVLQDQKKISGNDRYVFTGRQKDSCISENTLNQAIKSLGVTDHVPHGWRSSFSTIANESGLFRREVIELSIAHEKENKVEAAYNRSQLWPERVKLMDWWAEFLCAKSDNQESQKNCSQKFPFIPE